MSYKKSVMRITFLQALRRLYWRLRPGRPEDIPKRLSRQALAEALNEAAFLRAMHVDVRSLEEGEVPGMPRPAGDFNLSELEDGEPASRQLNDNRDN